MRKLGRYAVRVAVAVFVLAGLLLLAANLYVQSRSVQQRIRGTLEANLKMPVSLRKTTVTPWEGLRLDGIILRAAEADGPAAPASLPAPEFVNAASFRVRFAWWPLLTGQELRIEQLLLDRPRVTWQEGWSFPPGQERKRLAEAETPQPAASPSPPGNAVEGPSPGGSPSPIPTVPAASPLPPGERTLPVVQAPTPPGIPVLVEKMRLRHGEFTYLDEKRRPQFRVEEVNLDGAITDPHHFNGALWFAKAGAPQAGAALTDYWTALNFDDQTGWALGNGRGRIAGGRLKTDFRIQTPALDPSFTANCQVENVALGRLLRPAPGQPAMAEGQLHAKLECRGFLNDPSSCQGGGRLWLEGAKLRDIPLLKIIGQALRIPDLSHLEFKQAEMNYEVAGTTVRIDPLVLVGNDVRVAVRGRVLIDENRLDLHGRLMIDRAVSHQLPQFIESNFTPCGNDAPGCRYLDFDVTGTPDDPQSNLYDRLTAGPMKSLLDNLRAPKSKNPKNKKAEPNPAPPPASESPAP